MKHLFPQTYQRGFTLIEVLVSLFVFVIIMTAVTNTFTSGFSSYKNTKIAQKNVEDAQFALNLMAKELRTSTITASSGAGLRPNIQFYDYSQGLCIRYSIVAASKTLQRGELIMTGATPFALCDTKIASDFTMQDMSVGNINFGRFRITPSVADATVGKVTVTLDINEAGSNQHARIQTTVSLRDYGFVGL